MIELRVIGMPGPQGSKAFKGFRGGHAILLEQSAKVKPWREAVVWAARQDGRKVAGAVTCALFFTMPKPKSAPKRRITYPDRNPDLDKLCRSTFDALTSAGTIEDDARIVQLTACKIYPSEHPLALDVPGVVIRISGLNERDSKP